MRHVLGVSGGKDSSALAIYLKDPERWRKVLGKNCDTPREPVLDMEYVFCDTGKELDETYSYLHELEVFLGKPITYLNPDRDFDHYLELYRGYLPSANMRWCTRMLKLKPFEEHIGDDAVVSYVGIRADENRSGYITTKPNITPVFPFKEDGIEKADVFRILEESGVGVPDYYKWRTRSGCYFCFFQRRSEWVGLKERHPDLYEKAKAYEKIDEETGEHFTWSTTESLVELESPERMAAIMGDVEKRKERLKKKPQKQTLMQMLDELRELEDDQAGCNICHL